jgi:hypothetical protein
VWFNEQEVVDVHVVEDHGNRLEDGSEAVSGARLEAAQQYVAMPKGALKRRQLARHEGEAALIAHVEQERRRRAADSESSHRTARLRGDDYASLPATGERHSCSSAAACAFTPRNSFKLARMAHVNGLAVPYPFVCKVFCVCLFFVPTTGLFDC